MILLGGAVVQEGTYAPLVRQTVRLDLNTPEKLKEYLDSDEGKKALVVVVHWIARPEAYGFVDDYRFRVDYEVLSMEQDSVELSMNWIKWERELRQSATL